MKKQTDAISRRSMLVLMGLGAAGVLKAADAEVKPAALTGEAATAKVEVKSTLENLQAAFNGESNASAKYAAFAKKADAEGYGKVASLFRAASKAEEIHAKNHAAVITKLGGKAKADIKLPEIKSTRENLQAALQGETYEFKAMYPAFLKKARADRDRAAIRTFNFATGTEAGHAKLYKEALDNLEAWKGANVEFFVCKECGNTVTKVDFETCPICHEPKSFYFPVK